MEEQTEIGPPKISIPVLLLKTLSGLIGGGIGTLVLLVIFVAASSILAPITGQSPHPEYISPLFIFLLAVMIFLSTTTGNILSSLFLALTERSKYKRISSSIYQIFIISLAIFLLMVPVYFITTSVNIQITAYAVALHIILSAQISAIILEIVSNYRHSLLGVYSTTLSILMSAGLMFGIASVIESPTILLFAALPIVWGSFAFLHSLVTMIYGSIARIYDKDFLSTQTLYGKDYGKQVKEESKEEDSNGKDQPGADFLRKN